MPVSMGDAVGYLDLDISGFMSSIQQAMQTAEAASRSMEKAFSAASKNIKAVGESIGKVGKGLTVGLTVPLTAAATASFKFANDFETSLAKVGTIADSTKKSMVEIEEEVRNLSKQTGISASEIAEATYQAISASVDTADAVEFAGKAADLARGGFTSLTTSVDLLTTIMNSYGMSADEVSHISDVLISTQNLGKTTVDELAQTMGRVIPTANSMGVSLEDLSVAYSYLTQRGINTAEATTYINGLFTELGKSSTDASKLLREKTGKSFQELMQSGSSLGDVLNILKLATDEAGLSFNDLFGSQEAARAALSLSQVELEKYNSTLVDYKTTQDDAKDAADAMADTTNIKLNVALQNLKDTAIELGQSIQRNLVPIIEQATSVLARLNEWYTSLSDSQQDMIVKVGAITTAIGPMLVVVGKAVTVVGSLFSAFSKVASIAKVFFAALSGASAPILGIVAAVGVLVAAFKTLWDNNEQFRKGFVDGWNDLKATFAGFVNNITSMLGSLGINWETITNALKTAWEGFSNALVPVFSTAWGAITTTLKTVMNALNSLLSIFISAFKGDWEGLWNSVGELLFSIGQGIWKTGKNIFNGIAQVWNNFIGPFQDGWEAAWSGISSFFGKMFEAIFDTFSTVINSIVDGFTYVTQAIGWVLEKLGSDVWGPELQDWSKKARSTFEVDIAGSVEKGLDKAGSFVKTGISNIGEYFDKGWSKAVSNVDATDISDKLEKETDQLEKDLAVSGKEAGTALGESIIDGVDLELADAGNDLELPTIDIDIDNEDGKDAIDDLVDYSEKGFAALSDNASKSLQKVDKYYNEFSSNIMGLWDSINSYMETSYDNQVNAIEEQINKSNELYDSQIEREEERYDTELDNLKDLLDNKFISDEEYKAKKDLLEQQMTDFVAQKNKEKEKSEKELRAQQNELARKQFEANKATEIANVWINLAAAIMKTYATSGWIMGSIFAGLLTAAAGVQTAAIAKQQFVPMFARGGIVDKPTLGIFGEAGREAIVPLERNTEWLDILEERINKATTSPAYNITFNSPKSIDAREASKLMRRTVRDLAEGF